MVGSLCLGNVWVNSNFLALLSLLLAQFGMAAADFILRPLTYHSCTESLKLLQFQLNLENLSETECRIRSCILLEVFSLFWTSLYSHFLCLLFSHVLTLYVKCVWFFLINQCYLLFNSPKQMWILKTVYSCPSILILHICIYGGCMYVCTYMW